ncbi:MAG: hypothetical protein QOJ98_3403 [Acidobacteriota bacterium]|jgi:hypothetical protein|nr:hypothetical protein [Acidobacteriota bacterium]
MRLGSATLLIASVLFAAILFVTPQAFTHPLPDSTIFLDVGREQVDAELRLPAAQFEIGFGKPVPRTSGVLSAGLRRDIARYVADHLSASHRDGTVWCTEVRDVEIVIEPGAGHSQAGVAHVYVTAALVPPSQATPRNFVLRTDLVVRELLTHRLFVYLRRDWQLRGVSVEPFVMGRITYRTSELAIDLFEGSE